MLKRFRPPLLIILGISLGLFFNFYKFHRPIATAHPQAQTIFQDTEIQTSADTAALPPAPNQQTLKIPILMYHHIGTAPATADATHKSLTVSTAGFEKQVQWLSENGYQSISLDNLYNYSLGKFRLPKNPVIFTFDDGYQDVFDNAVPILKQYNYSGAFGIITQFVGQVQNDNIYASRDAISNAKDEGMEIVCHTQNHFDGTNPKFDANYIFENLSGCQKDLAEYLATTEPILIYPYGHYNSAYIAQAKKAGFAMGITVHEGKLVNLDDLMEIPRIRIHANEDFEIFKKLVSE